VSRAMVSPRSTATGGTEMPADPEQTGSAAWNTSIRDRWATDDRRQWLGRRLGWVADPSEPGDGGTGDDEPDADGPAAA